MFHALTSTRPYKPAWELERALGYLRDNRGSHFQPELVDLFMSRLPEVQGIMQRWAERAAR